MNKKIFFLYLTVLTFSLFSCNYDLSEFLGRDDTVNNRSSEVKKITDSSLAPDTENLNNYSVIFISDLHFGRDGKEYKRNEEKFYQWLEQTIEERKNISPVKFIVNCGDNTEKGWISEYKDYKKFCDMIEEKFSLKIYSVPGNHDLYNSGWKNYKNYCFPYISSYTFETVASNKKLSWYFLDSASGTLGPEQLDSVKSLMKKDKNDKIVISHYPIYCGKLVHYFVLQNTVERDELLTIFAKYNVKAVFEGHKHEPSGYDFKKFYEKNIGGFVDYRYCGILEVNMTESSYSFSRCNW